MLDLSNNAAKIQVDDALLDHWLYFLVLDTSFY